MIFIDNSGAYVPAAWVISDDPDRATCPACGSTRVYHSRRRNLRERLEAVRHLRPYRCHQCCTRFLDRVELMSCGDADCRRDPKTEDPMERQLEADYEWLQ